MIKKIIFFSVLSLLNGCATFHVIESKNTIEYIDTMHYDQTNAQIYATGRTYDYQLDVCSPRSYMSISDPRYCTNTFKYILTHKNQILLSKIKFSISTGARNEVEGSYTTYLKLNLEEAIHLNKTQKMMLRMLPENELRKINQELKTTYTKDDIVEGSSYFYGRTIQLKNRSELLTQGRLKKPLEVPINIKEISKSYSFSEPAKGVGKTIGAVVLAPIGLVLMLPYTGVMAYCEPNNC